MSDLQTLQAQLQSDPALQAYLQAVQTSVQSGGRISQATRDRLSAMAASLPPASQALLTTVQQSPDIGFGVNGQIGPKGFDPLAKWVVGGTAALAGGLLLAGVAGGAAAAGGGTSGGGAGAGTGATTLEGLAAGPGATSIPAASASSSLIPGAAGAGEAATAIPGGAAASAASEAPALWSGAAPAAAAGTGGAVTVGSSLSEKSESLGCVDWSRHATRRGTH